MRARRSAWAVLATLLVAHPATAWGEETLHYRWHLEGFMGAIASIFFPSSGEATLSVRAHDETSLESELYITSPSSESGEFFRYGATWEPSTGRSIRAWSDYKWRGKSKSRESDIDQAGVIDIVSAIQTLRLDPPSTQRRLEIWSDGHLYPVVVLPRGDENRKVAGTTIATRHYSVLAIDLPDRRRWSGGLDLWISLAPNATPVEMLVSRSGARLRLELTGLPDPEQPPGTGGSKP